MYGSLDKYADCEYILNLPQIKLDFHHYIIDLS